MIFTATAESIEQVKELLVAGFDRIYVGEADNALRIPTNFTYDELREIAELVNSAGKELTVDSNAHMHQ
ncbi:U32 family peptidase, partial [Streptococcus suis]